MIESYVNAFRDLNKTFQSHRITAIDFIRGIAIILMALDHASTYWNKGRIFGEGIIFLPYYPSNPDLLQFFVRFVTHYCAPIFIFLAGTSIALSESRKLKRGSSQTEITDYFTSRGFILLLIQWTVIAYMFRAEFLYFGVLACIGFSIIILAHARRLTTRILTILSISLILISPLFFYLSLNGFFDFFPYFLRVGLFFPEWPYGLYPLSPWLGVMGLGYVFGRWLIKQQEYQDATKRIIKNSMIIGSLSICLFFILRISNVWLFNYIILSELEGGLTLTNFFLLSKYPPSFTFLLWTLGCMFLALAFAFYVQEFLWFKKVTFPVILFGTTPLFFYSTHLILYGSLPYLLNLEKAFSLTITIIVWVIGLIVLFPLCIIFLEVKRRNPNSILKYI